MMRADCGCFLGGGTWHASHLNAGTTQVATRDPKGSAFCWGSSGLWGIHPKLLGNSSWVCLRNELVTASGSTNCVSQGTYLVTWQGSKTSAGCWQGKMYKIVSKRPWSDLCLCHSASLFPRVCLFWIVLGQNWSLFPEHIQTRAISRATAVYHTYSMCWGRMIRYDRVELVHTANIFTYGYLNMYVLYIRYLC